MAFAVGDEVALIRAASSAGQLGGRNNVLFGVIAALASQSDMDVLWESGTLTQHLSGVVLDKIQSMSSPPDPKVVIIGSSPEYTCLIARCYSRQTDATGPTTDYFLLRDLNSVQTFEETPLNVASLPGR
jgi:hypothetical protein